MNLPNALSRADWAARINGAWRRGVESIFDVGRVLTEAKAALEHGEFEAMVGSDLPFKPRTARMFMAIARDERLTNRKHVSVLPPSWGTLYELTKLDDEEFDKAISAGAIRPDMERKEVVSLFKRPLPPVREDTCTAEDLSALVGEGRKYGAIYADPPWLYDNQGTRAATGNHYLGLTVEQLCELPVRELAADDAHLHMWTTNGFLFDAPQIFSAWGFEFRSSFVWVKPQMGIGNYWRNSHEFLLTAIRGDAKRFNDKNLMSWLECARGKHSAKPEQVRTFIERASPGPYLELFGRNVATGWTVWGNEIERRLIEGDVPKVA